MEPQQLLDQLGRCLGFALPLNENGLCRVLFRGDAVNFEAEGGSLWLVADLGPVPHAPREEAYAAMLAANAFGRGTRGAVLGINSVLGSVCLHRVCPPGTAYPDFERMLIDFIVSLRQWKQRLMDGDFHGSEEADGGLESGDQLSSRDILADPASLRV